MRAVVVDHDANAGVGRGDRVRRVVGASVGHRADHLTGRRVGDLELPPRSRRVPTAVDEHGVDDTDRRGRG